MLYPCRTGLVCTHGGSSAAGGEGLVPLWTRSEGGRVCLKSRPLLNRCRRSIASSSRPSGSKRARTSSRWRSTRRCTTARSRTPRDSGPRWPRSTCYWHKKWDKVLEWEFDTPKVEWFKGGKTNVAYNCVDRHLTTWRRNKAAIIWESDEGRTQDLHLPVAVLQGVPIRQRSQEARHQEGRPRRHLHADDSRARHRDARVCAHRCDPLDRVRRLLGTGAARPHPGLRSQDAHHGR